MVRTGANGPPRVRSRRADGVLFVLALVASSTLQGCLPPDWSFCDCDFRDNFWDSILNDVHLLWDGPDFVRKARDNRTFQGRYLQSPPSDLNCPVNPSVFWKAWPQYGITRGLIEGSMGDLWMPGARDRFKQVCIAGHLALMAICSQHFLVKSARAQEAGDPDHMKWLEASFGHMVAIRNLGQAYQIRQCMGQQGWSLDVGAFHKYTERWIGREAAGTVPQAAFFNGQVDPWQMLFTKPMHHNEESRAAALPDRRVCVPFKDPACWKRKSQLLIETCEYCCNPFQHKTGRGASWCWDDEWTYERCCQQDYKDLVCEVQRKGEEGGCVDCKKSVTYNCMTPPEKRLKDAQDNYNKKVDLFNSLQDKARTLAQDTAAARADLISKDATYQELHADLNTKLRIWHVAFNNASRLLSAARLRQQELTWNNSNAALQQAQATLRSAQGATSTAQATVAEARRQEQLGKQLLANNESAYAKAQSHQAATKEALTKSQDQRKAAETVAAEAEATLEAAKTTAKAAFETSLSANESSDATHRDTRKPLEEASSLRDALRATAWASQSRHAAFSAALQRASSQSASASCQERSVDTATTAARVRSAERSVKEAAAVRNRSAEDLQVAAKAEELFHQVLTNCTVGPHGSSAARCLIDVTPANKSAKPLLSKSSWRKELCNTWQAPHGCPDGQSCDCSITCDSEPNAQASEMRINTLVQQMLETQRLAEQALARQRSKRDDFDDIEVYIPAELISAMEAATQKVASVKEKQAAATKDSREAQNMLEKAKSDREAADKKQRTAQDKLVQAQSQEKDLLSQLTAARADLDRNMTSLQELRQRLAEANQTAQKASTMLAEAIRREDWSKTLYHNLTKEASRKREENNTEVLRRDEADKKVQALNQSLAENLTVLVSAWLRQQETAGEASHSARWSERLLAAAKAVLVNMVGSFESFLENYVISISDKDAAMQVMRAVEDLKAVELSALEAEKNAEDAAEQVRQAEGKVAEAEAARTHSDSKARNATSAVEEAKDVLLSAERLLNQTRVVVDTVGQQLQDVKTLVGKIKAEVDAAVSDHQKAVRAVEQHADSVRTTAQNVEAADAEVAKALAGHSAAEAKIASAKDASLGSSLQAAKRKCKPSEQEFQVYLHFREHLGLAKHVVVQRMKLLQLADGELQREVLALQDAQVLHETLQDDVLDADAAVKEHAAANAAADMDAQVLQAWANKSGAELSEHMEKFRVAQGDVNAVLKKREEASRSSLSLATAYLNAASQREASEGNLLRRKDELEAAKNQSTRLASELVKSVEAEAAAKKSAEEAKAWQASFNTSLQIGRKEGLLREAQQEQQRCEEAEVNASKRETRMRSLLNTHKKHLVLCDLQVELPEKEALRLEAKAAFDKAEKALLEAQKKLESLASEEAETHESIGKTYKELEELKVEHSIADKEYNDQDAQLVSAHLCNLSWTL
ncbi:unnamed protein product [Symbiodinium sp. CCMP2456]|nr:unnamed protein product [Symbiodinium sp. CCMP2456]